MSLSQSDYIALAAVAISALSALYARWAVNEAKRANEIALQLHKVEIYEEVVSFSECFRGFLSVPTTERLNAFRKKAVQRAELYLSEEVSIKLNEIYEYCSNSEMWLSAAESAAPIVQVLPNSLEVQNEYRSVLKLLYPVIEKIKAEAKLNNA